MDRERATPDVIEREMEQTRASLTDKVAALEGQVVGTLQTATDTVHTTVESVQTSVQAVKAAVEETMSTVKDSVTDSVQAVTSQVKSTFDFSHHVRDNPWMMVGGAAAVGFLAGFLIPGGGRRELFGHQPLGFRDAPGVPTPPSPSYAAEPPAPRPAAPREPSWIDDLLSMAGKELLALGREVLTNAVATAKQSLNEQVPHLVDAGIASATQSVASRLPNGARV
jgi:ElaB/YqjD/DUF883 family membrane-anchored ribosome-binding protein